MPSAVHCLGGRHTACAYYFAYVFIALETLPQEIVLLKLTPMVQFPNRTSSYRTRRYMGF